MKLRRLSGLAALAMILAFNVAPLQYGYDVLANDAPEAPVEEQNYYVETFLISGYYSPLPNQPRYAMGNYAAEIRMNGRGTNGASGAPVFPGMVACPGPRTYPDGTTAGYRFDTKFYIPGIGLTNCQDRGGAIVMAGERSDAPNHRLDIWFGHGMEGLTRALNWGKRTVEVRVYAPEVELETEVYFNSYLAIEDFVQSTILSPLHFKEDIFQGTESDQVGEMVAYLKEWGYYDGADTNFYGPEVAQAIFNLQTDFDIVTDATSLGAGHFGINTRTQFDKLIKDEDTALETVKMKRGSVLMEKYTDLNEYERNFTGSMSLGDTGPEVTQLQEELQRIGLLYNVTGVFDEVTQHAVFKFQQIHGLVMDKDDVAAGFVGPKTRSALNKIIKDRYRAKSMMAYQREEFKSGSIQLALPEITVAFAREQ